MNQRLAPLFCVVCLVGSAFFAGYGTHALEGSKLLAAQDPPAGRGPTPPAPTGLPQLPPVNPGIPVGDAQPLETRDPLVYGADGGQAAIGNGIIAVTGSYGVGTSVLYVVDTENRQIAVYEARGGSTSMRRLVLVGARRIDLDLQLEGYNDESEYDYEALTRRFDAAARGDRSANRAVETDNAKTGLERRD